MNNNSNKDEDIDILKRFKYTIALGLNKEQLSNYYVGDEILDDFRERLFKLNEDEEFIKYMEKSEKAVELYKQGLSLGKIASKMNTTVEEVKELLGMY